jgi:uncharacterized protein (TIGR03435 family)
MNKFSLSILLLLVLININFAYAEGPKPGETAPRLSLTGLLQASGELEQSIKSLEGKVIVLEFWATWCAPCIASMPHLNELSDKFKNKGVQFISITNESAENANKFLKTRKINGWVGIDGDNVMSEAYGLQTIPFTVIIGSDGKILGYPNSKDLSEDMLTQALAGKVLVQPTSLPVPSSSEDSVVETASPLYELSIRPSTKEGMSNSISPISFQTKGASALELIKIAFNAEQKHVELIAKLPDGKFDVVATNSRTDAPNWEWKMQLQRMLQDLWKIDIHLQPKEMEIYELVTTASANKRLIKAEAGENLSRQSSDDGVFVGRNLSLTVLAKIVQEIVSVPVMNATSLKGNYDFNLLYDEKKPETIAASLEEEMGLKLRKVKRQIEVLTVGSMQEKSL